VACSRTGGAHSGGAIVGGDGGRFELGRPRSGPFGPDLCQDGSGSVGLNLVRLRAVADMGGTTPGAALLQELCGAISAWPDLWCRSRGNKWWSPTCSSVATGTLQALRGSAGPVRPGVSMLSRPVGTR
jgi:hypothetical protein